RSTRRANRPLHLWKNPPPGRAAGHLPPKPRPIPTRPTIHRAPGLASPSSPPSAVRFYPQSGARAPAPSLARAELRERRPRSQRHCSTADRKIPLYLFFFSLTCAPLFTSFSVQALQNRCSRAVRALGKAAGAVGFRRILPAIRKPLIQAGDQPWTSDST